MTQKMFNKICKNYIIKCSENNTAIGGSKELLGLPTQWN